MTLPIFFEKCNCSSVITHGKGLAGRREGFEVLGEKRKLVDWGMARAGSLSFQERGG